MIYVLLGFAFGLLIPYIARRFEKFMPATAAYALYRIIKPNKFVKRAKRKNNHKHIKLMKAYMIYSLGWAVVCSALSYLALVSFGSFYIVWNLAFIWILLLLFEIDKRMFLLPDILTIPLLISGFLFAALTSGWIIAGESAVGAFAGYLIPVIASIFLVWKHKEVFGGGDIKLLAAVGAWVGIESLLYIIILSCVIFVLYALANRKRDGAFGPSIVMASIIVAFMIYGM
ncbi:MAG: A24 family peptidase [Lactobacillaceae bacterium]|nr:A24 family peptidase [Lactobacillaceae bacterium]